MVVGNMNDTNLIENEKLSPVPSETIEETTTIPFRPMFKKKTDRSEKVLSNESEISQSHSITSKERRKGNKTRVSLSFDDDSMVGPSIKRTRPEAKSSENDSSSSSVESSKKNDSSRRRHKHLHSRHKHSSSKRHKKKKKNSKDYDVSSKKKSKKRSCDESEDERRRSGIKKKRHEDESRHDRSRKHHRNKDSHRVINPMDKANEDVNDEDVNDEDVNDKKFKSHSEMIIHKREEPSPSLIKSKEKQITSPRSKNDSKIY